ncbi:MAG: hypothetical protein ACD_54C00418G0004, partial [uncultured bacterium]
LPEPVGPNHSAACIRAAEMEALNNV